MRTKKGKIIVCKNCHKEFYAAPWQIKVGNIKEIWKTGYHFVSDVIENTMEKIGGLQLKNTQN